MDAIADIDAIVEVENAVELMGHALVLLDLLEETVKKVRIIHKNNSCFSRFMTF